MRHESPGLPHTVEATASRKTTAASVHGPAKPIPSAGRTPPATSANPTTPAAADAFFQLRLGALTGTVLEIGPGWGPTLVHYSPAVHWIGVEPDTGCHPALRSLTRRLGLSARVLSSRVESLDLPAMSVDAVVSAFALCSVADQRKALQLVHHVLRPNGVLVFQEHVAAAPGTLLQRGQQVLSLFSGRGGCHPGRDTAAALQRAGFVTVDVRTYTQPGPLRARIPHIVGEVQRRTG